MTALFVRHRTQSAGAGDAAAMLLACMPWMAFWSVGGLETPLYCALLMSGLLVHERENQRQRPHAGSALPSTRPRASAGHSDSRQRRWCCFFWSRCSGCARPRATPPHRWRFRWGAGWRRTRRTRGWRSTTSARSRIFRRRRGSWTRIPPDPSVRSSGGPTTLTRCWRGHPRSSSCRRKPARRVWILSRACPRGRRSNATTTCCLISMPGMATG